MMSSMVTYFNGTSKRLVVESFVFLFNIFQINIATTDEDSDKSLIIGSGTFNSFFELFGKKFGGTLDAFDCKYFSVRKLSE